MTGKTPMNSRQKTVLTVDQAIRLCRANLAIGELLFDRPSEARNTEDKQAGDRVDQRPSDAGVADEKERQGNIQDGYRDGIE